MLVDLLTPEVFEMKSVVFEIKPLFYSYKSPIAYQIKSSNILPPPSSLLGAIYKNYVKLLNLEYSKSSLESFLCNVRYAGLTLLPLSADSERIIIKKFPILLKHHRIEKDSKGSKSKKEEVEEDEEEERRHRVDAMAREYIFTNGRIVGVFVAENVDPKLIEAIEGIEYLGNSESMVSVEILDRDSNVEELDVDKVGKEASRDAMLQMVSDNIELLPVKGVIEQCGRIPSSPWQFREIEDICYIWSPLEPVGENRYKPLSCKDVISLWISNQSRQKIFEFMSISSYSLGIKLVFSINGFNCLYTGVKCK